MVELCRLVGLVGNKLVSSVRLDIDGIFRREDVTIFHVEAVRNYLKKERLVARIPTWPVCLFKCS